jgi:hypothetical protein
MYTEPEAPQLNPKEAAMRRDHRRCRFRFAGCEGQASKVMLDQPEWLAGEGTVSGLRAVCASCAATQAEQRDKAAAVFGIHEGNY